MHPCGCLRVQLSLQWTTVPTDITHAFALLKGYTGALYVHYGLDKTPDWSLAVGMKRPVQRHGHQAIDACTEAVGSVAIRVGR